MDEGMTLFLIRPDLVLTDTVQRDSDASNESMI